MEGYQKTTLDNGTRIVTETVPHVRSVSVGIWVGTGTRDENPVEGGISHFVEHMMFKGTAKRNAREIAEALDAVGGQLNAFTDKEYTCYYAKVLGDELEMAFDVLSDMLTGSLFDPVEFDREKNVVQEEIKRHEDTPEELIHDFYSETIWPSHSLGRRVIGTEQTVVALTRDDLLRYVSTHYTPDQIVVAAAGRLRHEEMVEITQRFFGGLKGKKPVIEEPPPVAVIASKVLNRDTEQVHFCLGTSGFSQLDEEKYSLAVMDSVLGGGMSSRIFQEVREKRGLAYSVGSYANSYRDGGTFTIYAGTSPKLVERVLKVVHREINGIAKTGISEDELRRGKSQIRGNLYLGLESMTNRMTRLGKSELYHGRLISPDEVIEKIEAISCDHVLQTAKKLFHGEEAYAAIGPFPEGKQ